MQISEEYLENDQEYEEILNMFYETEESAEYLRELQHEREEASLLQYQWLESFYNSPINKVNCLNDSAAKEYDRRLKQKMNQLETAIVQGWTRADEFVVFGLEAGLGKSRATTESIRRNMVDLGNKRTFLVVKRFVKDIKEMEQELVNVNRRPKGFDDIPNVLGLTKDNWKEWREKTDDLSKIQVLIITHKRYLDLCLNEELRQSFTEGREVLIIDEKINFPVYSYNDKTYNQIRSLLPTTDSRNEFDKVCEVLSRELEQQFLQGNTNRCERVYLEFDEKSLNQAFEELQVTIGDMEDYVKNQTVKEFLEELKHFYTNMCLYNGQNILTFNRKYRLWGLQNNIILDASAPIDGIYKSSDHFNLIGEERIVDHSHSKFYSVNFNTSKTNLVLKSKEFFPEIAREIKKRHKQSDQTLIICHKENYQVIERHLLKLGVKDIHIPDEELQEDGKTKFLEKPFAINWFGNIIGKNEYTSFTQCWIIGTPNIPFGHYAMQLMMYEGKKNLENKSVDISNGEFKNEALKAVQKGYVSAETYQSFKRIQRSEKPKGEFFLVNNDPSTKAAVFSMFKGVTKVEEIELEFVKKKKEERKGRKNTVKLIDYFKEMDIGTSYSKKKIIEELSFNSSNFSRVLNDDEIRRLSRGGYIEIGHRSIKK